jgi:carbon starvation protein
MPTFTQPINYVAFFPAIVAVLLIIIGALLTPITGVKLVQPAWRTWYTAAAGPIWPMLFVAIACGAISGWHSLLSSSSTSKQLDIETDAHSVGAGAMLTEGLLALASLGAFMVLTPEEIKLGKLTGWPLGATRLAAPFLGGAIAEGFLKAFFSLSLIIYALTVQTLVTRFMRLIAAELFPEKPLGQKHIATILSLLIAWLFAISGSWINLWMYFGGSNQLMAGLALMLVSIYLAKVKARTGFTLGPAIFMIITTLAALLWEIWIFVRAVITGKLLMKPPLAAYPVVGYIFNVVFIVVGVVLFILGIRMALLSWRAYTKFKAAPAEA